jgi:hypothetical protein
LDKFSPGSSFAECLRMDRIKGLPEVDATESPLGAVAKLVSAIAELGHPVSEAGRIDLAVVSKQNNCNSP